MQYELDYEKYKQELENNRKQIVEKLEEERERTMKWAREIMQYKFDDGKWKFSLVPPKIIEAIARVREYGANKYETTNGWQEVESIRYYDAMQRHICAMHDDLNAIDEESGLPHLWHVACNVAFMCEIMEETYHENTEFDS